MKKSAREQGASLTLLWKLLWKNFFSIMYFVLVGLILSIVYTQFLVKPTYQATGNIENIGGISSNLMPTVSLIAKEDTTIEKVVENLNYDEDSKAVKIAEIKNNLVVSTYNTSTYKISVSYKSGDNEEVVLIVDNVIEVTIERFIELNPSAEGKIQKQTSPIIPTSVGLSSKIIYLGFVFGGAVIGVVLGIGSDLVNRKLYFATDIEEFGMPFNYIDLKRNKEDKTPILENKRFKEGILILQDKIEGSARRSKAKVIGVSNLGFETYDTLSGILAENIVEAGVKVLVIDLDFEKPSLHTLFGVDRKIGVTSLLTGVPVKPLKVKNNLYVLPTEEYAYPARFLKDEKLHDLIRGFEKEFDYVIINTPITEYYASIMFNFNLIDMLLINTSVDGTMIKDLDSYIENIEPEHHDRLFLNTINSSFKKDYFAFIKKLKKTPAVKKD